MVRGAYNSCTNIVYQWSLGGGSGGELWYEEIDVHKQTSLVQVVTKTTTIDLCNKL